MRPKVGIAGPMTGPRRAYGDQIRATVAGFSPPFDAIFGDDRADPETAQAVAMGFVRQGVDAVIGHFNSECARRAGRIYRQHGLPFLLPASTAPGLAADIGAFRLCADETRQVAAMAAWYTTAEFSTAEIWHDGTAYGRRLAAAAAKEIGQPKPPGHAGDCPVFLFGTHLNIARQINARGTRGDRGPFVVCDDCTIAEFARIVNSRCAGDILVARPDPDFFTALTDGLALLAALDSGQPLLAQLSASPAFARGERPDAGFVLGYLREPGPDSAAILPHETPLSL